MEKINIIGTGLMGSQIAAFFYVNGFDVKVLYFHNGNKEEIARSIKVLSRKLPISKEGRISITKDYSDLLSGPIIETVKEDLQMKKEVYAQVKKQLPNETYFSNTSSFSPNDISADVNGMHFYNPILLGLVELYFSEDIIKEVIGFWVDLFVDNEFEAVIVGSNRGYIGNYVLFSEISSAFKLLEKYNYKVFEVNNVYKKLYRGRNIFNIVDLIGVDVVNNILINLNEEDSTVYLPTSFSKALEQGVLGKKNSTTIKTVLNES